MTVSELDNVWLHIDAAWAGVSFACPEFRQKGRLFEINAYADSFCTNFHKWGLVNLVCTLFLARKVRGPRDLTQNWSGLLYPLGPRPSRSHIRSGSDSFLPSQPAR